ncbi:MAG: MFS transporter [Magnetospiraceae bacterium]
MRRLILPVFALLSSIAILMMGNGLLTTLIGVRLGLAGSSEFTAGLVTSGYFGGLIIGAFLAPKLIERVGHIRTFAAAASIFSAAAVGHAFFESAAFWWGLRLLEGLCMASLFICAESWLNERSTNETRGAILSVYTLTAGIFMGIGQFFLNLADISTFTLFAVASILLSISLVPLTLNQGPTPSLPESRPLNLMALLRASPLSMTGALVSGLALGAFYGVAPLFGQRLGLTTEGVARLIGLTIIGGMVLQYGLGRISDKFERRLVILIAAAGLTVASLCIPAMIHLVIGTDAIAAMTAEALESTVDMYLLPVMCFYGGFLYTLYPLSIAQLNDRVDPREYVVISGAMILTYSVGAMLGPILGGGAMQLLGQSGMFLFTGVAGLALAGVAAWRRAAGPSVSVEEQSAFQPVPRTTPVIYELDPRVDADQYSFDFDADAAS